MKTAIIRESTVIFASSSTVGRFKKTKAFFFVLFLLNFQRYATLNTLKSSKTTTPLSFSPLIFRSTWIIGYF